jgi:addiction module HigA family antidote
MLQILMPPVHPGTFVRMEILAPRELSVTAAAAILGVTRQALSTVLNGRAALTAEMGLRLEKAFGVNMDTLLRMQLAYDIVAARKQQQHLKVKPYKERRAS